MGMYMTQLIALIWKNFMLKRRNVGFFVVEVIAPLIIFLIIVIIRADEGAQNKPPCHLQSKSLLSAGFFSFAKSIACSYSNKCFQFNPDAVASTAAFDLIAKNVSQLMSSNDTHDLVRSLDNNNLNQVLEPGGMFNISAVPSLLNSTTTSLSESTLGIAEFVSDLTEASTLAALGIMFLTNNGDWNPCVPNKTLPDYIRFVDNSTPNRDKISKEVCSLPASDQTALFAPTNDFLQEAMNDTSTAQAFMNFFFIVSSPSLRPAVKNTVKSLTDLFSAYGNDRPERNASLLTFFCGELDQMGASAMKDFNDTSSSDVEGLKANAYEDDPDLSKQCNDIFRNYTSQSIVTSNIWSFLKPVVVGNIYYTPINPETDLLMATFDKYFNAYATVVQQLTKLAGSKDELYYDLQYLAGSDPSTQVKNYNVSYQILKAIYTFVMDGQAQNYTTDDLAYWEKTFNQTFDSLSEVSLLMSCFLTNRTYGVSSETKMQEIVAPLIDKRKVLAGIVFENFGTSVKIKESRDAKSSGRQRRAVTIPKTMTYKIRLTSGDVPDTNIDVRQPWTPEPLTNILPPSLDLKSLSSGQVILMDILEKAFIRLHVIENGLENDTEEIGTWIKQFPTPCYIEDYFLSYIKYLISFLMVVSWIAPVAITTKSIVYEKESRLKEVMRIMGLKGSAHWLSYFVSTFTILLITLIFLSIIVKYGKILTYSDITLLLFLYLAYAVATIMYCFVCSVCFGKANLAAAVSSILFFITWLPFSFYQSYQYTMPYYIIFLISLLPNTAFSIAIALFVDFERQGVGAQWVFINRGPDTDNSFSVAHCILMLYIDSLLFLFAALLIERLNPGEFGVQQKLCKKRKKAKHDDRDNSEIEFDPNFQVEGPSFEKEPEGLEIGVQVRNLMKVYSAGNKKALNNLNINFYRDQITSFLGHNGAGKTTTMSIICGLYRPTSGAVFIDGISVQDYPDLARKRIGICPQYNVLFGDLTVLDHLVFYAKLRGKRKKDIKEFSEQLLKDLELPDKANIKTKNLSGGMKRRLSVAISFIGDNTTVILDEPTAGVDPHSRRGIWELLAKYKKGRTILLSTHHMDEADVLGDRIAIINDGELVCAGTSLFLRRQYAEGYQLVLVRDPEANPFYESESETSEPEDSKPVVRSGEEGETDNQSAGRKTTFSMHTVKLEIAKSQAAGKKCLKFIKKIVNGASLNKSVGFEMTFTLPYNSLGSGKFTELLEGIEANKEKLGISDYGVSDTSLEDIFLTVAEQREPEISPILRKKWTYYCCCGCCSCCCKGEKAERFFYKKIIPDEHLDQLQMDETAEAAPSIEYKCLSGRKLKNQQIIGLYLKRWDNVKRSPKALFSSLILPPLFIFVGSLIAVLVAPANEEQPNKLLTVYDVNGPKNGPYMFGSLPTIEDPNMTRLMKDLIDYPHHSFRCIKGLEEKQFPCIKKNDKFTKPKTPAFLAGSKSKYDPFNPNSRKPSPECDCESGYPVCDAMAGGPVPPRKTLDTTDKLQNLTSRNISDYILKTRLDYKFKRLYGYEVRPLTNYDGTFDYKGFRKSFKLLEMFFENNTFVTPNYTSGLDWVEFFHELNSIGNYTITKQNVKVWWNNKAIHGLSSTVNALNNLVLRYSLPSSKAKDEYGIKAYSHPWARSVEQIADDVVQQQFNNIILAIWVIIALSFVPASFVVYLVEERNSKSKHLQYVSGVTPTIFWISAFIWDLTAYMVSIALCIIIFVMFQEECYVSKDNFGCLLLLLLLYSWAVTPLMYLASYIFRNSATAYVLMILLNFFVGYTTTLVTFMFDLFKGDMEEVNKVLEILFLIFPQYCLGRSLFEMALNQAMANQLQNYGTYEFKNPVEFDIAGKLLLSLSIQGFVFFAILLLFENRHVIRRMIHKKKQEKQKNPDVFSRKTSVYNEPQDYESDVVGEEAAVLDGDHSTAPVVVKQLRKRFGKCKKTFVAVRNLTFHVNKGSCFGLLGVNGAGKTTTFQMLTGDILPTKGKAFVGGYNVVTHLNDTRKQLGYCPQFDALDNLLTVRENLKLYARLRGIPKNVRREVIMSLIRRMELSIYADRMVGTLSGGNKRKLSTAIALLGDPQIVFLDEPTAGMDPKARRFLWKCVLDAVKEGRSVVLTSHSMEECEALCTTLAIMVNGEFKCMGTTQHLKNKYGEGYLVEVKTKPGLSDAAEAHFLAKFPNAIVKDKLPTLVMFQVPVSGLSVAEIFKFMEESKAPRRESGVADLSDVGEDGKMVDDYSISQTTLDQLFISFANMQTDAREGSLPRTTLYDPRESKYFSARPVSDDDDENSYVVGNERYDEQNFQENEDAKNEAVRKRSIKSSKADKSPLGEKKSIDKNAKTEKASAPKETEEVTPENEVVTKSTLKKRVRKNSEATDKIEEPFLLNPSQENVDDDGTNEKKDNFNESPTNAKDSSGTSEAMKRRVRKKKSSTTSSVTVRKTTDDEPAYNTSPQETKET